MFRLRTYQRRSEHTEFSQTTRTSVRREVRGQRSSLASSLTVHVRCVVDFLYELPTPLNKM